MPSSRMASRPSSRGLREVERVLRPFDRARLAVLERDERPRRLEVVEVLRVDVGEALRLPLAREVARRRARRPVRRRSSRGTQRSTPGARGGGGGRRAARRPSASLRPACGMDAARRQSSVTNATLPAQTAAASATWTSTTPQGRCVRYWISPTAIWASRSAEQDERRAEQPGAPRGARTATPSSDEEGDPEDRRRPHVDVDRGVERPERSTSRLSPGCGPAAVATSPLTTRARPRPRARAPPTDALGDRRPATCRHGASASDDRACEHDQGEQEVRRSPSAGSGRS